MAPDPEPSSVSLRSYVDMRFDDLARLINAQFEAARETREVAARELTIRLDAMNGIHAHMKEQLTRFELAEVARQHWTQLESRLERRDVEVNDRLATVESATLVNRGRDAARDESNAWLRWVIPILLAAMIGALVRFI